jgi:HPt (histidine-containing phosphotransfer) domain-containing protein
MSGVDFHRTERSDLADGRPPESAQAVASDFEALVARCMGNLDFAERIMAKFQTAFARDLAELEEALRRQNDSQVAQVAHRMKGASANTAALRLEEVAAEIEKLSRNGRFAEVPPRMDELRHEWSRYLDYVRPPSEAGAT